MKKIFISVFSMLGALAVSSEGFSQVLETPMAYEANAYNFTYVSGGKDKAYYTRDKWGSRHRAESYEPLMRKWDVAVSSWSFNSVFRAYLEEVRARDVRQVEKMLVSLSPADRMVASAEMKRITRFSKKFPSAKFYKKIGVDGSVFVTPKHTMLFKEAYQWGFADIANEDFGSVDVTLAPDRDISSEDTARLLGYLRGTASKVSIGDHKIKGQKMHRADIHILYRTIAELGWKEDVYLMGIKRQPNLPPRFVEEMRRIIKEKR